MNKQALLSFAFLFLGALNSFTVQAQELAPEIMNLRDHDQIPASVFEKYDSVTIGKSLVARLRQTRDRLQGTTGKGYYDFRNDTLLQIVFPSSQTKKFVSLGFQNSHQARRGLTNPAYSGDSMLNAEAEMIGLYFPSDENVKESVYSVLPHYSYLTFEKKQPTIWNTRLDKRYGNVVGVLNNSVKDRATFAAGNSWLIRSGVHTLDFSTDVPFPEPDYISHGMGETWGHHWEAQIWGELTFKDVNYFMVNCPVLGSVPVDQIDKLAKTGIPIYQCLKESDSSRLFPGNKIRN